VYSFLDEFLSEVRYFYFHVFYFHF